MARMGLTSDRKFRRLARLLDDPHVGFGEVIARGALELLWDAAYEACDDFVGDETDVEAAAHWRGKTGVLCAALVNAGGDDKAGFIEEGGSPFWPEGKPGTYRIHDLWDHAPDFVEKRVKREIEREAKGTSLKELRAAAGRKGRAAQLGRANGGQLSATPPVNGGQTAAVCPDETANGGQASGKSRHSPAPSSPAPSLPVPPASVEERTAGGKTTLGPLTAELRARLEKGLGYGLIPCTQQQADRLEQLVEQHGGVNAAVGFVAATCRKRDTDPKSLAWVVTVLDPSARQGDAA